jgi:hypothetical protein
MAKLKDALPGAKFGRLTVIEQVEDRFLAGKSAISFYAAVSVILLLKFVLNS